MEGKQKGSEYLLLTHSNDGNPGQRKHWRSNILRCVPTRYTVVTFGFLGMVNIYALRINLSMAIVAMTGTTFNSSTTHQLNWTTKQQGWILSSFFYGYIITQIPGGYLAAKFGGRYVFGIGILMTALLTLLSPLAAQTNFGILIALRVAEGLFEGVAFPAMHAILGKWSPPKERTIMSALTYSGVYVGNIISFPFSAVLCEYGFAGGWPSVFYIFGILGVVWFFFWPFFGFDSPASHPRISHEERHFIESSIDDDKIVQEKSELPWLSIMTSPAVWAISISSFCNDWGFYILLTCIPSYFKEVLGPKFEKNLIQNGMFSALPYVAFSVTALTSGYIADCLQRKKIPVVLIRKLFSCTAFVIAGTGLIAVGYFESNEIVSVLILTFSVGFLGLCESGYNVNAIDIAPQYAGVLMGITNTFATIPGIIGPLVAETIAHKPDSGQDYSLEFQEEWKEVFIIAAEVYFFGAIIYFILAEGKRQHWAGGSFSTKRREVLTGVES